MSSISLIQIPIPIFIICKILDEKNFLESVVKRWQENENMTP